jgi:hypothetical protein
MVRLSFRMGIGSCVDPPAGPEGFLLHLRLPPIRLGPNPYEGLGLK